MQIAEQNPDVLPQLVISLYAAAQLVASTYLEGGCMR